MNYNNKRFINYKEITYECPFCERICDIYGFNQHMNTKRCKNIQELKYNEIELKEKKIKLLLIIDKLRYNKRNNIE